MVFPVVMYECETSTIKKAEPWRTDVFELWCWRRLLRVPWTARRSNQSILKEINSLEGLTLKLQYFGHLIWTANSMEKNLMLGKIEGKRRKATEDEMVVGWHHWFNGYKHGQTLGYGEGQAGLARGRQAWWGAGRPGVPQSMRSQRVRLDSASEHMHTHDQEGVNSQKYINSSYISTSEAQATWF